MSAARVTPSPTARPHGPDRLLLPVVVVAVALATLLAAASLLSAHAGSRGVATTARAAHAGTLFTGIAQRGAELGSPAAPVTLVEYADLQCPYCAEWARSALPVVVQRYVRTGKVRLVFDGLAFIGPDSDRALRAALAAGQQGHLWDLVHGLYVRQGAENSGWVSDGLVTEIGRAVPGLDTGALLHARDDATVDAAIRRAYGAAQDAGVHSTRSFQIGRTGGPLTLLHVGSLNADGITRAIDAALAR